MSVIEDLVFQPSSTYGSGIARRHIRLTSSPGSVLAELEDHAHAMVCRVGHADGRITGVDSEFRRFPLNTCPGAANPLRELIGLPIGLGTRDFFAGGRARQNCTHMLDLAWLAARHACREAPGRLYAMDIPDAPDGHMTATLRRDGAIILEWTIDQGVVTDPAPFAGQQLYSGFVSWVLAHPDLSEDEIEAVLVLQKGCFVSLARRVVFTPGPLSESEKKATAGLCYGFGTERIDQAERRAGQTRDFTDHPEKLLQFL
jgi:hypothetical protein